MVGTTLSITNITSDTGKMLPMRKREMLLITGTRNQGDKMNLQMVETKSEKENQESGMSVPDEKCSHENMEVMDPVSGGLSSTEGRQVFRAELDHRQDRRCNLEARGMPRRGGA